jgi:hypothetical protein
MNFDANNLYGKAMKKPLPVGGFQWGEGPDFGPESITKERIMAWTDENEHELEYGCCLMVDIKYPNELHDLHNAYPMAVEKMTIKHDMTSPYNRRVHRIAECDENAKIPDSEKLVPNLFDKKHYVVHYMALQQMLEQGLVLEKVHKVLWFNQVAWLSPFIDFNTVNRKKAKASGNKFLEDFYKLMNNSIFGKTMENVRKRRNLTLHTCFGDEDLGEIVECKTRTSNPDDDTPDWVNEEENEVEEEEKKSKIWRMSAERKLLRRIANCTFTGVTIFNEHLVCIEQRKVEVKMYKPIYVGACILDISKTIMYDFHYNVMMKKYTPETCKLLFTDTDSLCYHIQTEDVYDDMASIKERFDFSKYPQGHALHDESRMGELGLMKDTENGRIIKAFVGAKPKLYAFKTLINDEDDDKYVETVKCKGINKCAVEQDVRFRHIENVLETLTPLRVKQCNIRSNKHQLYTIEQEKVAATAIDTKRWILDDGITSYALGHHKISELNLKDD